MPEVITDWDRLEVPSVWQMFGYEKPYYANVSYPHPVDPPYVPDENPCGAYRTYFDIEDSWEKRRTCIVFEDVAPCFYLYINGEYAGFAYGSHSCGPELLEQYRLNDENIEFEFYIKPIN